MEDFTFFGSPMAACTMGVGSPQRPFGAVDGPLQFQRTPNAQGTCEPNRFSAWFEATNTPPSASMASVHEQENTPPHAGFKGSSPARFASWLQATSAWTPGKAGSATPLAPAPSPNAACPMSLGPDFRHGSAVSPARAQPRSRPLFDLEASSDSDEDEAATTVGEQEVSAAAARTRAALLTAGAGAGPAGGSSGHAAGTAAPAVTPANSGRAAGSRTPPRVPAPTPAKDATAVSSSAPDALLQQAANSLATPLSQLSVGGRRGLFGARGSSTPAQQQAPASPVDKVIGLMLSDRSGEHGPSHGQHTTPSRLRQQDQPEQPPPSPEAALLQLMTEPAEAAAGSEAGEAYETASEATSTDLMDLAELEQLVGPGSLTAGTPLSDILELLLSPADSGRLTPGSQAQRAGAGAEARDPDGVGPRTLHFD